VVSGRGRLLGLRASVRGVERVLGRARGACWRGAGLALGRGRVPCWAATAPGLLVTRARAGCCVRAARWCWAAVGPRVGQRAGLRAALGPDLLFIFPALASSVF